mmetsp:Transcript_44131/g.111735  ORF Transcript_44131/g.111735 Transcript_44131/m.111735 type:complete len:237 (-) Transcript_44131:71-781(-)
MAYASSFASAPAAGGNVISTFVHPAVSASGFAAGSHQAAGSYPTPGGPIQLPGFAPPAFDAPQLHAQSFQHQYGGATASAHHYGAAPTMPPSSSAVLPTPEAVQSQKEGYINLLDEQLKQGQATLDQQRQQQTEYLYQQAQQQKQQVEMQIKQQVQQQEMTLLQNYNQQLMAVQQASSQQKVALEQQAMQLTMEYQQKKSQEEMMHKQATLQREHVEAQMKFAQEMQKLQQLPLGA